MDVEGGCERLGCLLGVLGGAGVLQQGASSSRVWCMPVVHTLQRVGQKDHQFEAHLDYIARPCLRGRGSQVSGESDCSGVMPEHGSP